MHMQRPICPLLIMAMMAIPSSWQVTQTTAEPPKPPVEFRVHRNQPPQWTAPETERGFVVCSDHWMRPMFDVFVPTRAHVVEDLSCELAGNEYESIQVGVHALRDLKAVRMTVELDLPFKAYRFLPQNRRLTVSSSESADRLVLQRKVPVKMPYFLFPRPHHKKAAKGETVGFWITVQAPANAATGDHMGVVRISAGQQETVVPLRVTVRPFTLPKPKIAYATYFQPNSRIPKAYQEPKFERLYYEDMAAHGMNSIELFKPHDRPYLRWLSLDGQFDEAKMAEHFAMMQEAGLLDGTQPVTLLWGNWDAVSKQRPETIPGIVKELERIRKKYNLPRMDQFYYNEPSGNDHEAGIKLMKPWIEAGWGFYSSIDSPPAVEALGPYHTAIHVHAFSMGKRLKALIEEAGCEFWTYESASNGYAPAWGRCYAGLFSWNSGVKGNYVWAYTHADWGERDRYTIEPDGSVTVYIWGRTKAVPGPLGPIPTINWEARREGVDDYRYLQLVQQEVNRADRDPRIVQEVSNWLGSLRFLVDWETIAGRFKLLVPENNDFDVMDFFDPYPQLSPEKYDQVRRQAAAFIVRLQAQRAAKE